MSALRYFIGPIAAAIALAPFATGQITMTATYYTVAETDPDMSHLGGGTVSNEVRPTLGPDGLPVLNIAAYGCTSNCFSLTPFPVDLTSSGEITWWSPGLNKGGSGGVSDVVQTGTGTITLPFNVVNFYPPNGTGPNDANGFQAAMFSTILNVPTAESISFNVGADDVAFVYLDGNIVCDLGGAHGNSPGTCTSSMLTAGSHTLQLFYCDIFQSQGTLTFGVTTSGITGSPVPTTPIPPTILLTLAGLACLGAFFGYRSLSSSNRSA